MRVSKLLAMTISVGLTLAVQPVLAASDYLLELDGVEGEAAKGDHKQAIEVSSFSWGASNPTSVGSSGMGAGKVAVQDMSIQASSSADAGVVSPRDAGSGLATGKRTHKPVRVQASNEQADVSTAPPDGSVGQLTVRLRESPTRASIGKQAMCATGKHISKATLRSSTQVVELHDAVVTSCEVQGQETKIVLTGTAKHTKTGHVTLLK